MKEFAPRQNMVERAVNTWSVEVGARFGAGIMLVVIAVDALGKKIENREMVRKKTGPVVKK